MDDKFLQMEGLIRWLNGIPLDSIVSYESLKELIVNHAKRDYLFFPFLIGHVERYLKTIDEGLLPKEMTLFVIYELLKERKVSTHFVSETEFTSVSWETQEELNVIMQRIKLEWDKCGDRDPEMNEVIWLTA